MGANTAARVAPLALLSPHVKPSTPTPPRTHASKNKEPDMCRIMKISVHDHFEQHVAAELQVRFA